MGDDDDGSGSNGGGDDDGSNDGGGVGPARIELSTATLDFGLVSVATPPMSQMVTVKNTGGEAALPTFEISGADAASFQLAAITCGAMLDGGASCTLEVNLNVGHDGAYQATLDVKNGADVTSAAILANSQSAFLKLAPPIDDFGDVNLAANQTHQYTVTNTGDAPLPTPVLSLTGAQYTTTASTCTTSLASGATCTFSVVFAPTSFGSHTAVASAQAGSVVAQSAIAGRGVSSVTINIGGNGSGSISGLSCASNKCTTTLTSATLAMSAQPSSGSSFNSWAGDASGCSTTAACNLQVSTGSITGSVTFNDLPTLTVGVNTGGLGGSVSLSTGGTVTGTKSFDFSGTTTVTLSASKGSEACNQFQGWGGACLGSTTSSTCTLTISSDTSVSAGFGRKPGCVDP